MDKAGLMTAHMDRRAFFIVAGNQWTAQLIRTLLTGVGVHDISQAIGVEGAFERLSGPVDLVIADFSPTTIDGFAFIERLRASPDKALAGTPCLLLCPQPSGMDGGWSQAFLERCKAVNINGLVTKPIVPAKLFDRIVYALPKTPVKSGALEAELPVARKLLQGRRILIATNNKFLAQLLRALLIGAGAGDITVAEDIAEAHARVSETAYGLVIVDSTTSGIDGLAFAAWLRGNHSLKTPAASPMVLLSSQPNADFVAAARSVHVTSIVAKPVTGRIFLNRVVMALSPREESDFVILDESEPGGSAAAKAVASGAGPVRKSSDPAGNGTHGPFR